MACTGQSAEEYIKSARDLLVGGLQLGGLQNLSIIVENLYQREVFIQEEVSKIETEKDDFDKTRTILNWVTKKGEAACYELLKIIDTTRKRTLRPELHQWISCFPFKDEGEIKYVIGPTPCRRYQGQLKNKARGLSKDLWKQHTFLPKYKYTQLSYTPLVLDPHGNAPSESMTLKSKKRKSKKSRPKKMKSYIPVDEQEIAVDLLLKTQEKEIVLVGKTGIGKTTAACEMLRIWGGSDSNDLDYMFYFDMRNIPRNPKNLKDLLFNMFSEPDEKKKEVLEDIRNNSENVTIIFDGLTDPPSSHSVIESLLKGDLLPDAKIVITCRPEVESEDFLLDWASLRVEVKGFSTKSIKAYLAKMLNSEQLSTIENNRELFSLCHVPVYALMVVACFSFMNPIDSQKPCTVTDICINILRGCIQKHTRKAIPRNELNKYIRDHCSETIFALAKAAFQATEGKSVNLTDLSCEESSVESSVRSAFLTKHAVQVGPTEWKTRSAFLHYTIQEFFAALWVLKNPDKITDLLQQCCAETTRHMRYLIPFLCGFCSKKNLELMKCLTLDQQTKDISNSFIKDVVSTFLSSPLEDHNATDDSNILFLCQCLYESQSTDACLHFLDKLDYCLDLSEDSLDPHHYGAVSYVISQSPQKIELKLEDTPQRYNILLDLCLHVSSKGEHVLPILKPLHPPAPTVWSIDLSERKASVLLECLKLQSEKQPIELTGWSDQENEVKSFLQCLPYISKLSYRFTSQNQTGDRFLLNLCLQAALYESLNTQTMEEVFSLSEYLKHQFQDFLLDLYSHFKDYDDTHRTHKRVLPVLQPVLAARIAVWIIDLSQRKVSFFLEVMKLQPEKKPVKLRGWSDEESKVRNFLQCLPYITTLSVDGPEASRFLGKLFCQAAEQGEETGEKILELLTSVCNYETFPFDGDVWYQCEVLLDLYSYVKNYKTKKGRSVLPALKPVFQSAPAVWTIDLSERNVSLLLEVLELHPEKKKPVELRDCRALWSDEASVARIFLQCLPYISQLSVDAGGPEASRLLGKLFCQAAEQEEETGEKILELLSSVCNNKTFPFSQEPDDDNNIWRKCNVLLDLYSHVKNYKTKKGRSVLPALKPVYQSAPAVWYIDLSERNVSILLEVLKLHPEKKKPVVLKGWWWSDEESEVRIFLQCLPYISHLSVDGPEASRFLGKLFCQAAEQEEETGEKILELLTSVCNYKTFPFSWESDDDDDNNYVDQCDVLLDLYSHVNNYKTKKGRSFLPALKPVFQSTPAVWYIDLSERNVSLLLEVLKLQQPEKKKPVVLLDCSDEASIVRIFLQCLPYISQLSVDTYGEYGPEPSRFMGKLFCKAAEQEDETGEKILELLSSVCNYKTFPLWELYYGDNLNQCVMLLDLYSHVKDYKTKKGRSVLPALKPVFQSAPAVWTIDLSKRNVSLFLEVLELHPEKKKPVQLRGWSDKVSEVRIFLQCLPYISQLRCDPGFFQHMCKSITVRSRKEVEQLVSLLRLLDFTLVLTGEIWTNTCKTVGKVLHICGPMVDLVLTPSKISLKGVSLLFRDVVQIQRMGLSESMVLLLFRAVRTGGLMSMSLIDELSLLKTTPQSERLLSRVVSNVASLLRHWSVRCLDMTKSSIPSYLLLPLLSHHDQLTIKLCPEVLQELAGVVYRAQDEDLAKSFLEKVGGDLTSCSLDWEVLLYVLQQSSAQMITVDLRKNRISERSITGLLPFLDRVSFKRPSPRFTLCAIRETYQCRSSDCVPSLLRSLDHVINLNNTELDTEDCDALLFTLKHCDKVTELSLLWTFIPPQAIESIMLSMDKVSQLRVDRSLLLKCLHCCTTCQTQQGAAAGLLRALQYRLDLSSSSSVDLSEQEQVEALSLTVTHCRDISTVLGHCSSSQDTQLILSDCEVEDSGLDLLFPVLNHLGCSKSLLLQLLSLVSVGSERDTVMRAGSLAGALRGELDLSETTLDQKTCRCLALFLEHSEGLTELDLSHCQLTDQLLETLIPHLHKAQVLDLSDNKLTDALTERLLQLLSINPSIQTIRLFNNCFVDRTPFLNEKHLVAILSTNQSVIEIES